MRKTKCCSENFNSIIPSACERVAKKIVGQWFLAAKSFERWLQIVITRDSVETNESSSEEEREATSLTTQKHKLTSAECNNAELQNTHLITCGRHVSAESGVFNGQTQNIRQTDGKHLSFLLPPRKRTSSWAKWSFPQFYANWIMWTQNKPFPQEMRNKFRVISETLLSKKC